MRDDLGLKTLRYRSDFRKLKWYCKVMSTKDERLPFKLLRNEWDKVKCKGCPKGSWLAQVLEIKIIKPLTKQSVGNFK